jgi:broad specificity phosphatase PhoE
MFRILFIRHAESEGNIKPEFVGGQSNHLKLTQKGITQAKLLGERFFEEKLNFDIVCSSTAIRASHTCQIVCEALDFDTSRVIYTDELLELSQGEWVGKLRSEVYTPETLAVIQTDPWNFKAPKGESQKEVEERALDFLEVNVFKYKNQSLTVGIFAHGLTIKCIFRALMNSDPAMTWKISTENTSITEFRFKNQEWFLEKVNDYAHLFE